MKLVLAFIEFYEFLLASKVYIGLKEEGKSVSQFLNEINRRIALEFERYDKLDLFDAIRCIIRDLVKDIVGDLKHDAYLPSTIKDFEFLLFSFADEFFIYLKWKLSQKWLENPMEMEEYGTKIAGELLFKKIDSFLENHGKIEKEMGALYAFAIALGFCGMHRNSNEIDDAISSYKSFLTKSFSVDYDIYEKISYLDPASYSYSLEKEIKHNIDYNYIYKRVGLALFILILALYCFAFFKSTRAYYEIINKLI